MLDRSKLSHLSEKTEDNLNVSPAEIARFDQMAEAVWDPNSQHVGELRSML